jgi:hypothetical protein
MLASMYWLALYDSMLVIICVSALFSQSDGGPGSADSCTPCRIENKRAQYGYDDIFFTVT